MDKLDLSGRLNFGSIDLTAPNVVIENLASQIGKETNGIIIGTVMEYDGPVVSYTAPSGLMGLQEVLGTARRNVDIQESLGRQGEELNRYEFYLNTPTFDQYQYRICFLEYGIANYPTKVVLEQSVADEINKKGLNSNYVYICNNRAELEELLLEVIYSKRIINIMQELIYINQIYQNKEKEFNMTSQTDIECITTEDENS